MTFSLFPKTIYKTTSKISGLIEVNELLWSRTLSVQNMIQSGGLIEAIWKKPIRKIKNQKSKIKDVLILGLGGGTVVHLINRYWPQALITGIELDPEIIKVGKEYFGLGKMDQLKIIVSDAFSYLEQHHGEKEYDLIVVDLYLGKKFPQEAAGEKFMKTIKRLLVKNGVVIFNRLRIDPQEEFIKNLNKVYRDYKVVRSMTNHFFLARSNF
ncbi:spermidine synthase [Patescibacteria group bacterium]